jgi:transcriptional regulator with XRE-family HTH domain
VSTSTLLISCQGSFNVGLDTFPEFSFPDTELRVSSPVSPRDVLRVWIGRKKGGQSQRSFAAATGLHEPDVSRLLGSTKDKRQPTLEWLWKVTQGLHITLSQALLEMARIAWELEEQQMMSDSSPTTTSPSESSAVITDVEGRDFEMRPLPPDAPGKGWYRVPLQPSTPQRERDVKPEKPAAARRRKSSR